MKAEIVKGLLVITPESHTEEYAVKKWADLSSVLVENVLRNETFYVKGSSILIRAFD